MSRSEFFSRAAARYLASSMPSRWPARSTLRWSHSQSETSQQRMPLPWAIGFWLRPRA